MAVPGQCWLEAVLEILDTVLAQAELLSVVLLRLQVPTALQVVLCLVHHMVAELVVEEGEQQDNQTDTHWKGNTKAGKVRYL